MGNKGVTRDKDCRAMDQAILAEIKLTNPGLSSTKITDIFNEMTGRNLSPRMIRYDLQEVRKNWIKEAVENFDEIQQIEFKRLDKLEQEAWDAWRASRANHVSRVVSKHPKKKKASMRS